MVPFVENAFKHGISYAEPSFIAIALAIEQKIALLTEDNLTPFVAYLPVLKKGTSIAKDDIGLLRSNNCVYPRYCERH